MKSAPNKYLVILTHETSPVSSPICLLVPEKDLRVDVCFIELLPR